MKSWDRGISCRACPPWRCGWVTQLQGGWASDLCTQEFVTVSADEATKWLSVPGSSEPFDPMDGLSKVEKDSLVYLLRLTADKRVV